MGYRSGFKLHVECIKIIAFRSAEHIRGLACMFQQQCTGEFHNEGDLVLQGKKALCNQSQFHMFSIIVKYAAYQQVQGLVEDNYVQLINCLHLFDLQLPPLAPNIFSCFSNHLGAMFFFFLLLSLTSSVLQQHHERGNFFSEYDQSIWLFNIGYYLEVSSSLLYSQELVHQLISLTILSSQFSSSIIFPSSPITSAPNFLVSLSHIKHCSKHNT